MSTSTVPVDVLAVMRRACTALNDEGLFNPGDDLCKATREVSDLILSIENIRLAATQDLRYRHIGPGYVEEIITIADTALARIGQPS